MIQLASRAASGLFGCLIGLMSGIAVADDGFALLHKMAQNSRNLTYSGTFVYRSGARTETSRIAHTQIDGRELEHIEVLDGSPREIIRDGNDVKCFLPDEKLLIIERRPRPRGFPGILPAGLGSLPEHYTIRIGGHARVAGEDGRAIILDPLDNLRYRHELWMDTASGLLLKAAMLSPGGDVLESFAFTQVKVGGVLDSGALKPRFDLDRVRVQQVKTSELKADELDWAFRTVLPGFRKVSTLKREASPTQPERLHVVFTDGLASISVFIEAGAGADGAVETSSLGAVNVYQRQVNSHRLLVMGEVPAIAVKRLADGIERRRK